MVLRESRQDSQVLINVPLLKTLANPPDSITNLIISEKQFQRLPSDKCPLFQFLFNSLLLSEMFNLISSIGPFHSARALLAITNDCYGNGRTKLITLNLVLYIFHVFGKSHLVAPPTANFEVIN